MNGNTKLYFAGFGVILLGLAMWYFNSLVAYILISVVFSFIGQPLVRFLNNLKIGRFSLPSSLNAAFTLFLLWFALLLFIRIFIPLVVSQADQLATIDTNEAIENLQVPISWIEEKVETYNLLPEYGSFEEFVSDKLVSVLNISMVSTIFGSFANVLGNIFVAFFAISFMTFFFLKDDHLFVNAIIIMAPAKFEDKIRHTLSSVNKLLMRYFVGILIQITSIIVLITTGLTIVGTGFDHALVIGLTVGIMNVVPYIGPIVGALIGLLIGVATHLDLPFMTEMLPLLGYMCIVFAIVQIVDNIFFQPLIYSNSVNAHPMEIFLVIMIAGTLAGVTGMILAIPVYTVLRVIAKEFFNKFRVVKKLTENI